MPLQSHGAALLCIICAILLTWSSNIWSWKKNLKSCRKWDKADQTSGMASIREEAITVEGRSWQPVSLQPGEDRAINLYAMTDMMKEWIGIFFFFFSLFLLLGMLNEIENYKNGRTLHSPHFSCGVHCYQVLWMPEF